MLVSKKELCIKLGISARRLKGKLLPMLEELHVTEEEYNRIKIFGIDQSLHIRKKLGI